MSWIIYNSKGEPLVTQEQHDHTVADASGPMTDDEHDGFSEYVEITPPSVPDASKARLFAAKLDGNDSIAPSTDLTGMYVRRPDGLMVKVNNDFPYSNRMRDVNTGTLPSGHGDVHGENAWTNYDHIHSTAGFMIDPLGCVFLKGLIMNGTPSAPMFALPEDYATGLGHLVHATIGGGPFARVDARNIGGITAPELLAGSNGYVALPRLCWPADGRINWHVVGSGGGEPAFENSWVNNDGGTHAQAQFAKDALGRVWVVGLVKDGADGAVFHLPVGYRPTEDSHLAIVANANVISQLNVYDDGTVRLLIIAPATNAFASINIMFLADGAADWHEVGSGGGEPAFENSWVNNGGQWDTCAFYKDAAGIVHIKGLIKDGTIGQTAFTLPAGYRPRRYHMYNALSSQQSGRLDIHYTGRVNPVGGSNLYFSVHCAFPAEQ